ncbi:MAG: aminotransferase class IV, partial [Propionibacteriales bacterium]|nr:aminotransferase class IV [Propionibacteriales bacterium]
FGRHLPDTDLHRLLSSAVAAAPPDVSVMCFLSARPGEFLPAGDDLDIDVLIKITDPATPPTDPMTLDVVPYERHLPGVKHVGEVAKTQYLRRARARGFDDAAFVDANGRLSEATIWNLAFTDGHSVIWPEAAKLDGVTMRILQRQLARSGVEQVTRPVRPAELDESLSAVLMNSWSPGIPVARIGEHTLGNADGLVRLLADAYAAEPALAVPAS